MATRSRVKAKKIKFELSRGAVAGIGVVVFCLFLWMFLLGLWAGQSFEFTASNVAGAAEGDKKIQLGPLVITAEKKPVKNVQQ